MPRVALYESGIRREGTTGAKLQPVDNGPSALGRGLQIVGQAGTDYVEKHDQIQDIHDRNDADKLALEQLAVIREQRAAVRQAKGSDAQAVVQAARTTLEARNAEILGGARSDRARRYLEQAIVPRSLEEVDNWDSHANTEFVKDHLATLQASRDAAIEEAHDAPDDEAAARRISEAAARAEEQARFEGHTDPAIISQARAEATSRGWVGRARSLASQDHPQEAWALMDAHRGEILEADELRLRDDLKRDLDEMAASSDAGAAESQAAPVADVPPGETAFLPPIRDRSTTVPGGQFGAPRNYGGHAGRDYAAREGTPVYPMAQGKIKRVYHSEGGGNTVEIALAGGWTQRVLHLQDGTTRNLREGQEVGVNDMIGGVGNTGTASHGNHAHVELIDPQGHRHDPAKVVGQRAALPPPDGRRVDIQSSYAYIDQQVSSGNWTYARGERAKQKLRESAAINDQVRSRREDDATRQALEVVESLGDKFTNMNQIPAEVRANMKPSDRISLQNQAQQNAMPKPIAGNGEQALSLTLQSIYDPEGFKKNDLRLYRHQVTPGEFASLATTQARMRQEPAGRSPTANLRGEIASTINFYAPDLGAAAATGGIDFNRDKKVDAQERAQYLRMFGTMEAHIQRLTEGKRLPTDQEMKAAFDRATLSLINVSGGGRIRQYEVGPENRGMKVQVEVPLAVMSRIRSTFARVNGREPTPQEIQHEYMDNIGRPGFW